MRIIKNMKKTETFGVRFQKDMLDELRRIAETTGADPSFLVRLAVADAVKRWRETGRVDMAIPDKPAVLDAEPTEAVPEAPTRRRVAPAHLHGRDSAQAGPKKSASA